MRSIPAVALKSSFTGAWALPGARSGAALLASALLLTVPVTTSAASKIYKTVDEDGNVVYTDVAPKETEAAEKAEVRLSDFNDFANPEPETTAPLVTLPADPADDEDEDAPEIIRYETVSFAFPGNDEAVRANNGAMTFRASIVPDLAPDHRLRFFIDGKPVGTTSTTSLSVSNVDRGTHDAQFVILDATGSVLAQSPSHVFHLQRVSIR